MSGNDLGVFLLFVDLKKRSMRWTEKYYGSSWERNAAFQRVLSQQFRNYMTAWLLGGKVESRKEKGEKVQNEENRTRLYGRCVLNFVERSWIRESCAVYWIGPFGSAVTFFQNIFEVALSTLDGAGLPNSAPFNEVQYASSVEARSVFFVLHFFFFSFRLSTSPPGESYIKWSVGQCPTGFVLAFSVGKLENVCGKAIRKFRKQTDVSLHFFIQIQIYKGFWKK